MRPSKFSEAQIVGGARQQDAAQREIALASRLPDLCDRQGTRRVVNQTPDRSTTSQHLRGDRGFVEFWCLYHGERAPATWTHSRADASKTRLRIHRRDAGYRPTEILPVSPVGTR